MLGIGETAARYAESAKARVERPWLRTLILGVLAGMFIALAAVGALIASSAAQSPALGRLLSALVFPAGIMLVAFAGAELFTGNCLLVIPVLEGSIRLGQMLKNWLLAYAGNLIGALLISVLTVSSGVFSGAAGEALAACAAAKEGLGFTSALIRGALCNVLVCAAVLTASGTTSAGGKSAALFFPVMLFVLSGFEHSVANMFYLPAASMLRGVPAASAMGAAAASLVPVTIGNIAGGAGIFAMPVWLAHVKK